MDREFIDKEEFKKSLIHCKGLGRHSLEAVLEHLEKQPAADPVEHGFWDANHECSVCGYWNRNFYDLESNYCPRCGAKMDKEKEEE